MSSLIRPFRVAVFLFPAVLLHSIIYAQLCNGSLGDPVVNITFGSGNSSGNGNYAPPAYTFTSSSCPNDGYYTITSYSSGCFSNAWHTVAADHTGGGNYMLVNASYDPGDFFLTTVTDLCPNTKYEFAAWLMNVLNRNGIRPNVTFSIEKPDGTLLGQYATGDIPETSQPTWQQYGLFFTTPPDNPVIVLRITNNAPGGNGNDIALDDITFRPCGPPVGASILNHQDTIHVCAGDKEIFTFNANISPVYNNPVYNWQLSKDSGRTWTDIPGGNILTYQRQPTGPGVFWYRLSVAEASASSIPACHISSNIVAVLVHAPPQVNAGPDRVVLDGYTVQLHASIQGDEPVFTWTPPDYLSDITITDPVVSTPEDISYLLSAVSSYGCEASDAVQVKVIKGIYVPTAFTPNNDGLNDSWRIPNLDPDWDISVNVYNRWGQLVYHTRSSAVSWDGTVKGLNQAAGVYVYTLSIRNFNLTMHGFITLIR